MQTTSIPWATYSVGFVTGCTHAGPGCNNCYAEDFLRRQSHRDGAIEYAVDKPWTGSHDEEVVTVHDGTPTVVDAEAGETVPTDDRREEPYEFTYPAGPGRIFVVSMGDLFHRLVPEAFIRDIVNIARSFPEHIWIFLTKRPGRAAEVDVNWPANAWVGTSVECGPGGEYPDVTHRIDQLRQVDAATRWVSFEPLIEPIGSDVDLSGIDWMVVGGESAPDADRREMEMDWVRELYRHSREQDVNFFFKQSSGRYPDRGRRLTVPDMGLHQKQKIEEYAELPTVTTRTRRQRATS